MRRNLVSSRIRWRRGGPMADHDRLPPPLRAWAAEAALPWSAASLRRQWDRALSETGCAEAARARLSALEARVLAREAAMVWGEGHPAARGEGQTLAGTLANRR